MVKIIKDTIHANGIDISIYSEDLKTPGFTVLNADGDLASIVILLIKLLLPNTSSNTILQ